MNDKTSELQSCKHIGRTKKENWEHFTFTFSLDAWEQQLVLVSAVVKKLISAIEDSPLRLEDHQALLFEAETTAVRSWAVGLCPPDQGPRDGEVFVFYLSLVLQAPYVGAEAGCVSPAIYLYVYIIDPCRAFLSSKNVFSHPPYLFWWHLLQTTHHHEFMTPEHKHFFRTTYLNLH